MKLAFEIEKLPNNQIDKILKQIKDEDIILDISKLKKQQIKQDLHEYKITQKLPITTIKDQDQLNEIFQKQLDLANTDYFYNYQVPDIYMEDENIDIKHFIKKQEDKIKNITIIPHMGSEKLDEILTKKDIFNFKQLQINNLDYYNNTIESKKSYEVAIKHNLNVTVENPLKSNKLLNLPENIKKTLQNYNRQTPDMWAYRFAITLENTKQLHFKIQSSSQVEKLIKISKDIKPLSDDEILQLKDAVDMINNMNITGGYPIGCSGSCGSCNITGCHSRII